MGWVIDLVKEIPLSTVLREKLSAIEEKYVALDTENAILKDDLRKAKANVVQLEAQVSNFKNEIEKLSHGESSDAHSAAETVEPDCLSIAVLPFANHTGDPKMEYFGEQLAAELICSLSNVEGVFVRSHRSTFAFKNTSDVSEIARNLNVRWIVEGSVQEKTDRHLKMTVGPIDTKSDAVLRSERYAGSPDEIFALHDEIVMKILNVLKVRPDMEETSAILKRHPNNAKAYDCYLKGCYFFNKHTENGWNDAIEYFREAISIEPEYARAYAGLSSVLAFTWFYGCMPPDEAIREWSHANERALKLGDELEESHIAAGRLHFLYYRNWKEAKKQYERAIQINPENADARHQYGLFLASKGRFKDALQQAERAIELEPYSLLVNLHVGFIYFFCKEWDRALERTATMIKFDPSSDSAYWQRGLIYSMMGQHLDAIAAYEDSLKHGGGVRVLPALAFSYGISGQREKSLDTINSLKVAKEEKRANAYEIAYALGGLRNGEGVLEYEDEVFEWLSLACRERNGWVVYLKEHSEIGQADGIWGHHFRNDLRFQDILFQAGLT
jgi:adenylate cyclase